ncbi:Panacea domain-containing protein [Glutamicibacter sp. BSL13]
MAKIIDVAQYIYDRKNQWVDAWVLQKLTYYAKAWSLAWDGDPIFDEGFQAWKDGPACSELHRVNKYEKHPFSTRIPDANVEALSPRQKAVVDSVLSFYGSMTKEQLIERTHAERPWLEARGNLPETAPSKNSLREETMKSTYVLQSLRGSDVPVAPATGIAPCVDVPETIINSQISKWADTLDWLVTR